MKPFWGPSTARVTWTRWGSGTRGSIARPATRPSTYSAAGLPSTSIAALRGTRFYRLKLKSPLYRLHNQSSSASGMTSMYNGSNGGASRSISPLSTSHGRQGLEEADHVQLINQGMSHSHTLPHNLSHHQSYRQTFREESEGSSCRQYGTLGRLPREQPPSYHILPRASYLVLPNKPPDLLNGSRMQQDAAIHSISRNVKMEEFQDNANDDDDDEDLYFSTKF